MGRKAPKHNSKCYRSVEDSEEEERPTGQGLACQQAGIHISGMVLML